MAAEVTRLADSVFAATLELDPEFGTGSGIAGVSHDRIASNAPAELRAAEQVIRVCRLELWGVASYVNGWQARTYMQSRIFLDERALRRVVEESTPAPPAA